MDIHTFDLIKHYKGNLYRVIAIGMHTETMEKMVIYKSADNTGEIWIRPLSMFSDIIDGKPRFELIERMVENGN